MAGSVGYLSLRLDFVEPPPSSFVDFSPSISTSASHLHHQWEVLFKGIEDVVNEETGLGGGIVAQTREATGGIGGAGTGGSRYVGLAGTMGHGFFREPIDQ